MEFLEIVRKRYSVRSYTEQKVEKEKLDQILEVARLAPTGANLQPQRLIVVQKEEGLQKLKKAANIHGAPCGIIVCSDVKETWTRRYDGKKLTDIDASIVTDHMMLAATDLGLGSVWICHFNPEVLKEEFQLPENLEPVNILAIGYASDASEMERDKTKKRKPLSETVFYEQLS